MDLKNSTFTASLLDNIDLIGIQVLMITSNVGLAFGNVFLKDAFIVLLELSKDVGTQPGEKLGLKRKLVLSIFMLSWAISCVSFTFAFTFELIKDLGIDIFAAAIFVVANLLFGIFNTTPLIGFVVMFSEICQRLNR